jgi:steroid delta-isomerase-like uncharacterized protein
MFATRVTDMTNEERNLGQRWFDEVWNKKRREAIAEMIAPDAVVHDGNETSGPEAFYQFFDRLSSTFPDIHVDVDDPIVEGNRLCVRWVSTGTHTGDGLGFPATGRHIKVTGISILRVKDGKFVESWQNWDMQGMMEQLKGDGHSPLYIAAGKQEPVLSEA